MHYAVYFTLNFLAYCPFIYKPEDLSVCPKGIS